MDFWSSLVVLGITPITITWNLMNNAPFNHLVMKSATILFVRHQSVLTSPIVSDE